MCVCVCVCACADADLETFDRGGPIEYPMGIYQNSDHTKIVTN